VPALSYRTRSVPRFGHNLKVSSIKAEPELRIDKYFLQILPVKLADMAI
jgi:hypothetical protein